MKKKQFESLCKSLLVKLPGFACHGWVLHATPVNHVLRGFCCDHSGFDPEKFTVHAFFLPLYVPTKNVYLNLGRRLSDTRGCEIWWDLKNPRLREELLAELQRALPFLERTRDPQHLPAAIREFGAESDPCAVEAMAYTMAMIDDFDACRQWLDRLLKMLDMGVPWQNEMIERATQFVGKLQGDPQDVKETLVQWENASLKSLGL